MIIDQSQFCLLGLLQLCAADKILSNQVGVIPLNQTKGFNDSGLTLQDVLSYHAPQSWLKISGTLFFSITRSVLTRCCRFSTAAQGLKKKSTKVKPSSSAKTSPSAHRPLVSDLLSPLRKPERTRPC